jgi:hypothetical protein
MNVSYLPQSRVLLLFSLLLLALPSVCLSAESPAALTVREAGVYLYSRQDEYSDKIAPLQKGEALVPVAEAVGKETWYLVQTKQGFSGWVRASDVTVTEKVKETFKDQNVSGSTWTALDNKGRVFGGAWTVERSPIPDKAAGTWTLHETPGKIVLRGSWSAQKFSTGWSGTWRASVEGQKTEYSGSWTADFPQARDTRFAELFEAAAREAIRGVWSGGGSSGSWSIRVAK